MDESRATGSSDTPKSRFAFLRHPLLVGAAVAVISAFFASLLIPSITQVTQDRPKELELKRGIVERIARATGTAWHQGIAITRGDFGHGAQQMRAFRQASTDWDVEASAVDGEITTYFGQGDTWQKWRTLRESTKRFLELTSVDDPGERKGNADYLCRELRVYASNRERRADLLNACTVKRFKIEKQLVKKHPLVYPKSFASVAFGLTLVLEKARDAVTLDIVGTPAAGFRHSPWSLG